MTYANRVGGRVEIGPSDCGRDDDYGFWTFAAVEERLIEAMRLWWRSPGEGKWPFAADAPWQWMTRRTRLAEGMVKGMDITRLLQDDDAEETRRWQGRERPGPLTRDEIARRDEASEWLTWAPARDRRLVILALVMLAAGKPRVEWMRLKPLLGVEFGADGLRMRYSRAVTGIARRLNG